VVVYASFDHFLPHASQCLNLHIFFGCTHSYGHMGIERITQMHNLLPSLKLIALIREPSSRAYSGFQHTCMKGRIFQIDPELGTAHSKSEARQLLRRELAGRVIIAENKSQAVEGLYLRFGRFAIFEVHLHQLEYPCSHDMFDDFLMISNTTKYPHNHLQEEVVESLLDVRGTAMSSILSHGLYAEAIADFHKLYSSEQLLILFTEELQRDLINSLDKVLRFLGIPYFDFKPFAYQNGRGGVVATFQRSKTSSSTYLPMSIQASQALDGFYSTPNKNLAKMLDDDRVASLWTKH
jgi:hypothetical protein